MNKIFKQTANYKHRVPICAMHQDPHGTGLVAHQRLPHQNWSNPAVYKCITEKLTLLSQDHISRT